MEEPRPAHSDDARPVLPLTGTSEPASSAAATEGSQAQSTAQDVDAPSPAAAVSPAQVRRPHRLLACLFPLAAVALALGALTALELTSWQSFDHDSTALNKALDDQDGAARQVQAALTGARSASEAATAVLTVQDGGLLTPDERAALSGAGDQAAAQVKSGTALIPGERPRTGPRKFWFWDVNADTARLERLDASARASVKALTGAEVPLRAATDAARTAGATALTAVADRASAAEAANVPADNEAVLDLRTAATQVKQHASPFRPYTAVEYTALVQAVQKLQASHSATLAAESGPLEQSRLDLEAFARSLAPGILMDFEWADLINGLGESNGYLSGETSWWYDRGGYATIRLSDSIAQEWPSDAAHAIVAHEVGHAITIRCRTMYDTANDQTAEAWATAWAISMGFTDDANGTSAYGSPPDSLIQTAAGCR